MKRFSKFIQESVELDEAVEVSHDRYMRSHGKRASGGHGMWMFTHKRMGDANLNDPKEVHSASGKFSDAKKSAQQWAKKHGHSTVYVMEEVQLDEIDNNTIAAAIRLKMQQDAEKKYRDSKLKKKASNSKTPQNKMAGKFDQETIAGLSRLKMAQDAEKKYRNSKLKKEEVELDESFASNMNKAAKKAHADAAEKIKKMGPVTRDTLADINAKLGNTTKKEEVELDEVSDKKLDAYRQKAFADQPSGDDGSNKYRKRKFGRDLAFAKQTGRAKVLATKEEVELEEGPIKAISTAFKKHKLHKAIRKTAADREQMIRQSKTGYYPDYADEYDASLAKRDELKKQLKSLSKKEEVEGLDEAEMSLYDKIKAARANPSPDKPVRGRGSKSRNPKTYDVRNTLDKEDDRLQGMVKKKLKKEEVELEEKAYVSSMSPELGRKGSHDVIGKDGKVVKSYPYTKDGMKAAQAHLSKMKEEVELDEVSASTLRSYVDKSRADKSRQQKARTVAKNDYKKYGIPSDKERADAAHRKASQRNTGISMAKRKLGGYTKGTEPKVLAREEVELDEAKRDIYHQHMLKALGKSRLPKDHSYTSAIANNGDFVVKDGGGRTVGRIAKGDHNLKEAAPKIKGDWLKKERERNREHDAAMGRTPTGRRKPVRQMTSTQRSLAKMRGESEE